MQTSDIYYTIESIQSTEIKVKGSRFISTAIPINSKDEAMEERRKLADKYHDASHNTFAYRIGKDGLDYRYSDDCEPNGTAGKPILFAIQKFELSDILVVVTRYFGGIKLGIGGLSRAYSEAANSVLKICIKKSVYISSEIIIFTLYEDLSNVKRILTENALSLSEIYRDIVEISAIVQNSKIDELCQKITDATRGRAGVRIIK